MSEIVEIILQAIDNATDVFKGVEDSANEAAESISNSFDGSDIEGMNAALEEANAEVERLTDELAGIYMGDIEGDASAVESQLAAAQEEAANLKQQIDDTTGSTQEAEDEMDGLSAILGGIAGAEVFTQLSDALMDMANKAGTVQDSWTRLGLAAEGAGIDVGTMKSAVSDLSSETGRAGGKIRESFIAMTSAGISDMDAMKSMFEGVSAQSFILGTDVESLTNKFAGMAMKSSVAERTLKGTGITVDELGQALGLQGATIDEINDKWETLSVDERAAVLGMASSMNEGKDANDEYKNSWEGLQAQVDIAKGKLEVLVGNVLLPVLVPALEIASRVLGWLGDTMSAVMNGPFGGLISIIGSVAAAIALAIPAYMALSSALAFIEGPALIAATSLWGAVAPLLPFIAIGAAIVLIIYEIGKAFGWWTDASSMIDAIGAGLQRLWDAFINNPDVQAFIQAMSDAFTVLWDMVTQAGQAVLDFFGINSSGNFDIVRALIDGIGNAWNAVKTFLDPAITAVMNIIDAFNQFRTGQMDLPAFIWTILTNLANAYTTIFMTIVTAVGNFARSLIQKGINAARNFVKGIINRIKALPGQIYSALVQVVSRIISAGAMWVRAAKQKAKEIVDGAYNTLTGLPGKVASALSGVVDAIVKPFRDAYDQAKKYWDDLMSLDLSFGGEPAYGGEALPVANSGSVDYVVDNSPIEVNQTLTLDLANVPAHIDTGTLIDMLTDRQVLSALTGSSDFQSLDARVKQRIELKNRRARGV